MFDVLPNILLYQGGRNMDFGMPFLALFVFVFIIVIVFPYPERAFTVL